MEHKRRAWKPLRLPEALPTPQTTPPEPAATPTMLTSPPLLTAIAATATTTATARASIHIHSQKEQWIPQARNICMSWQTTTDNSTIHRLAANWLITAQQQKSWLQQRIAAAKKSRSKGRQKSQSKRNRLLPSHLASSRRLRAVSIRSAVSLFQCWARTSEWPLGRAECFGKISEKAKYIIIYYGRQPTEL